MVSKKFNFYYYLKKNDFCYNEQTIENYLLSLKSKTFVILTGNSGTGKTKLAQLFAKYLTEKNSEDTNKFFDYSDKYIELKSKFKIEKNSIKLIVNKNDILKIFPISKFEGTCEINVSNDTNNINDLANLSLNYDLYIKNVSADLKSYLINLKNNGEDVINLKITSDSLKNVNSNNFSTLEEESLPFSQPVYESIYKEGSFYLPDEFFDYLPFVSLINCDATINTISTTFELHFIPNLNFDSEKLSNFFKENINEKVNINISLKNINWFNSKEDSDDSDDLTYKIVPVGADWTENRNLLGYENIITSSYHTTPALNLILRAKKNSKKPYFLILDEMNLSHVERYFSDFLSAMESGEPITLYSSKIVNKDIIDAHSGKDEDLVEYEDNGIIIPSKLKIPKNLFIIGTVNIDETTYMFSPKVLDRANVLELETIPPEEYKDFKIKSNKDISFLEELLYDEDSKNFFDFINNYYTKTNNIREMDKYDLIQVLNHEKVDILDDLNKELTKFQIILSDSGFEIGFRVINDILRFMVASFAYKKTKSKFKWEDYFDAQIKQKILPKLHGSEREIEETLENLLKLCIYGQEIKYEWNKDEFIKSLKEKTEKSIEDAKYKESAKKLDKMIKVLEQQKYVSFIN